MLLSGKWVNAETDRVILLAPHCRSETNWADPGSARYNPRRARYSLAPLARYDRASLFLSSLIVNMKHLISSTRKTDCKGWFHEIPAAKQALTAQNRIPENADAQRPPDGTGGLGGIFQFEATLILLKEGTQVLGGVEEADPLFVV